MKSTPAVSVCIANYNGKDVIELCIDSVLAQVGDLPVEIIVHDDCSTDGSADLIETRYPMATLIRSASNVGFCVSNNRMVNVARGEFLLLLNNDAALFADAIQTLHSAACKMGCPAILGLPQYNSGTGALIDIGCLLDPFLNPVPNFDPGREDVAMVIGACMWIPRALWEDLGGFPEWFGSIAEDMYLCCRARLAGYRVQALGRSGYRHRVGASFGGGKISHNRLSSSTRRRALSERNKTFVLVTTYPALLFACILPVHLVLLNMEGVVLSAVKRDWAPWRSIYAPVLPAIWHERKRLWRVRNSIQSYRRVALAEFIAPFRWFPRKLELIWRYGVPDVNDVR